MNKFGWIFIGLLLLGDILYAQGKLTKDNQGLHLGSGKIKTYYENSIICGDYIDHDEGTGVHNTEVIVWGEDWEYRITTDDEGNFKVEVKPDSQFKIKASDGNVWAEFNGTLEGVPLGTTKNDKTTTEVIK